MLYPICEHNPESCDYISWNKPKPGEKWNPEDVEDLKKKTKKKKTKKKKQYKIIKGVYTNEEFLERK